MSHPSCPRLAASLSDSRRGVRSGTLEAHVASCPDCGPAVALDRALSTFSAPDGARPFPSSAAIWLESVLVLERRRLASDAAFRVGVHALAFAVCVGLLVTAWTLEVRTGAARGSIFGASLGGAVAAVAMSLWSLIRAVDEAVFPA